MKEIQSQKDIKKLLYKKVPQLVEKLDICKPEECLLIIQVIKEIAEFAPSCH